MARREEWQKRAAGGQWRACLTLLGVGVMEIESMVGGGFGRCHGDGAGKQSCMHDTTPHVDMIDIETAMC